MQNIFQVRICKFSHFQSRLHNWPVNGVTFKTMGMHSNNGLVFKPIGLPSKLQLLFQGLAYAGTRDEAAAVAASSFVLAVDVDGGCKGDC